MTHSMYILVGREAIARGSAHHRGKAYQLALSKLLEKTHAILRLHFYSYLLLYQPLLERLLKWQECDSEWTV